MTIDPGARQETTPWTTFAQSCDIPDWISKAYIESYRGPHDDGARRPRKPAPST